MRWATALSLAGCLILAGCYSMPPGSRTLRRDEDHGAIAALEAWSSVAPLPECEPMARLRITILEDGPFRRECLACPAGAPSCGDLVSGFPAASASSCIVLRHPSIAEDMVPTIVLSDRVDFEARPAHVAHEILHLLHHCEQGTPDRAHAAEWLWASHGAASIEAMALRQL